MTAAVGSLHQPAWARLPKTMRRFIGAISAAILCVAVAAVALTVLTERKPEGLRPVSAAERADVERFTDQVKTVVAIGGPAVVYGMRPGISDINDGRFPQQTLVQMAQGWLGVIKQASDKFASLPVDPKFASATGSFTQAMARYVDTANALVAAAQASGAERSTLVQRAASLGDEADQLFNRATAELNRLRARAGLPPADLTGGSPR